MITLQECLASIKEEMKKQKFTQIEMSNRIGCTQSNLCNFLNGKRTSLKMFNNIQKVLKENIEGGN